MSSLYRLFSIHRLRKYKYVLRSKTPPLQRGYSYLTEKKEITASAFATPDSPRPEQRLPERTGSRATPRGLQGNVFDFMLEIV